MWGAWLDFRRGKRKRPTVQRFETNAVRHVLRLHRALTAGSYRPEGYRLKLIRDPKVRLIAAAPVRDRIVHHAVYRVLAPKIDRGLIDSTYACLEGRGSHRAVLAFQRALRRYQWAVALDIRHYFLSIDRSILMSLMARRIKDPRLLSLLQRIMDSGAGLYRRPDVIDALGLPPGFPPDGCGLPIGNLTSQWWANHYLSGLDHHLKRTLRIPYVIRYNDDFVLFHDDRDTLEQARPDVIGWLAEHRRLVLKDPNAPVRSTREPWIYLGYRVDRKTIGIARERIIRAKKRLAIVARQGDPERLNRSLDSYRGWISFPAQPPARRLSF